MRSKPTDRPFQPQPSLLWSGQAPARVAVLIPAYQPPLLLEPLIDSLADAGVPAILLIDDGSSDEHRPLFNLLAQRPRVHLLRHPHNQGKGAALKTGIRYFLQHLAHYKGLVTADADGQHAPADILRLARALHSSPRLAVLGARSFPRRADTPPSPPVPLRSRIGNRATAGLFHLMTGIRLTDAQTGLRALPTALLAELVQLPGSRYEFEMAALLYIARSGHPLAEQPVRTLYPPGNSASHFRPIADSCLVLRALLSLRPALAPEPQLPPTEQQTPRPNPTKSPRTLRTK